MPGAIDHLVIAVPDPDAAAADLEAKLGIAVTGGGEHPGVGTYNRLAFLGDAFLELIGVLDAAAAARWPVGAATLRALAAGSGFATYALLDDDLQASVPRLREAGSAIGPVVAGSRRRPDGEVVEWWTATFTDLGPGRPPFLIRHAYRGAEWAEEAMESRRAYTHPAGTTVDLRGLDLATNDPGALAETYTREVGLRFEPEVDGAAAMIGPHRLRLTPASSPSVPVVVHLRGGRTLLVADLFGIRFEMTPA